MMQAELKPRYDSRKSFYGKAIIAVHNDGLLELHSYGSLVASVEGGRVKLFQKWDASQTTVKHVREFLRQLGLPALNREQIREAYA